MNVYNIGDKVRILHTDYTGEGLEVGTVHEVSSYFAGTGGVELYAPNLDVGLYFSHSEVEPYTPANTIQPNHQYTSKNGQKWECIAVRGDTAWLVGIFDGVADGGAYMYKLDGSAVCLASGSEKYDIKWEPAVEWVDTKGSWAKAGCHPQRQYNYAIRFPLIDGKPDFTQATVTPV